MTTLADAGTVMDTGEEIAALETIRRGIAFSPSSRKGSAAPWPSRSSRRWAR